MIERIIEFSAKNKYIVALLTGVAADRASTASRLPSGLKETEVTLLASSLAPRLRDHVSAPVLAFQSRTVPSALLVTTKRPSGDSNAT